ncbi:thiamine-phosphate kinase [Kordiimonas aquimaris]|uniref:thiamine-phosphate kinase n=1 Tax=Kordiimonas aquimaris TaxID=707591 RepID=UPI0021CED3E9|nr:thiamine-phosphate kinase [Kordiimonas aquimaris]
MSGEFELIKRYFAPLAGKFSLNLSDDAACIPAKTGFDSIVTKDIIVEGTHFHSHDPVDAIAYKAIAVNVSDCIAKGATPDLYWLGLALPKTITEEWFTEFAIGLGHAQTDFGCLLAGGDTTTHDGTNIMISVTMAGHVPAEQMIKRSGAHDQDDIYVTGYLGEAALGLVCIKENSGDKYSNLIERYLRPNPPIGVQNSFTSIASASADVSDGLLADIGHICESSNLGCIIKSDLLPVSVLANQFLEEFPEHKALIWSGGDDYQVVFTADKKHCMEIDELSKSSGLNISKIGHMTTEKNIQLLDSMGEPVQVDHRGFKHF